MYPRPVPAAAPPRPYTVSELIAEVSGVLRTTWRDVSVVGEIARYDLRNGHGYFTLKDKTACVSAIIFASDLRHVPFRLQPGLEIVVRGSLDLYAPQGRFQIKASTIEPVGQGALQLAFEQKKARLAAEGLFAPERKRPIPRLPRRIALITSPTGSVLRDMLNVLGRRFRRLAITVYPVRVQGELAAGEIAAAVRHLNRRAAFDVLIVARGGGSPEDLAPFNDENLARALAASRIPTISGVGHETDWTICDLVADLRAPTPSAAAELVIEREEEIRRCVARARQDCIRTMRSRLSIERSRVVIAGRSSALAGFPRRVTDNRRSVAEHRAALVSLLERRPAEYAARVAAARRLLQDFPRVAELARRRDAVTGLRAMLFERRRRGAERRRSILTSLAHKLDVLSPLAVLARGYSVVFREGSRRPILSAEAVRFGDRVRVQLSQGTFNAIVRETSRKTDDGPLFQQPEEES
ncbi:MAG TPA: exodeoxyribonuclease VII large subunit [Thermoanaerobaculia bacterium]|nr:exodeoxyribonuclease VII large subunit [Thermoanaerobaculia bacterium]